MHTGQLRSRQSDDQELHASCHLAWLQIIRVLPSQAVVASSKTMLLGALEALVMEQVLVSLLASRAAGWLTYAGTAFWGRG